MKYFIQSISDIITNSSSEVFVIETKDHTRIKEFFKDICDVLGYDHSTICIESVNDENCDYYDECKKGDLIISSPYDYIPYIISQLIEEITDIPSLEDVYVENISRKFI